MLLDPEEELGLLLIDLRPQVSVEHVKDLPTNGRSDEPPRGSKDDGKATKREDGIQGHLRHERLRKPRTQDTSTDEQAARAAERREEDLDAAAAHAQLEEGVPIQRRCLVGGLALGLEVGRRIRGWMLGCEVAGRLEGSRVGGFMGAVGEVGLGPDEGGRGGADGCGGLVGWSGLGEERRRGYGAAASSLEGEACGCARRQADDEGSKARHGWFDERRRVASIAKVVISRSLGK